MASLETTRIDINRIFIFNNHFPVRKIIEMYTLMRLIETPSGLRGCDIKEELSNMFQNSWVPSNKPIYETLHDAEDEGKLRSKWIGNDNAKDQRIYYITDTGISSFQQKIAETVVLYNKGVHCTEVAISEMYPKISREQGKVSPTHSPPLNTTLFTELMILRYALKHENWFTSSMLHDYLEEVFGDSYMFADSQVHVRFMHLTARGYLTSKEFPSVDDSTPEKNRGQKAYHITTSGQAQFTRMVSADVGFYARIKAINKGLVQLHKELVAHQNKKVIHRNNLRVVK